MKIKTTQSKLNDSSTEFNTTQVVTRKGKYFVCNWQKTDDLLKVLKQGLPGQENVVIAEFRSCWMPRNRFSDYEYEIGRLVMQYESEELLKLRKRENQKILASIPKG